MPGILYGHPSLSGFRVITRRHDRLHPAVHAEAFLVASLDLTQDAGSMGRRCGLLLKLKLLLPTFILALLKP